MVEPMVAALLRHAGGWDAFAKKTALLMRRAVDEVIDAARTNRFTLMETEKTEKTYLGTKVENLFRWMLDLPRGHALDLNVDGVDADVKNTMGSNWEIPGEAVRRICVLIAESEAKAVCSVGVFVAHDAYLRPGKNQDGKRSVSAVGKRNIWWILRDHPYPPNPWQHLPQEKRLAIMGARGGTRRVASLFEILQDQPISRNMVLDVGQQKDSPKRLRRNGGARDYLAKKGIAVLYGRTDREMISRLGLPAIGKDEFISHSPRDDAERTLLRTAGHID
jgi:hypothetical protein